MKVSIIMPVYNSEVFLKKAINSVLNQTYKNFELILIDDGSTDHSGEICDLMAKNDGRIIAIHQKNSGICKTRNLGLKIASGDYIAFIDNDDCWKDTLLADNIELINQYSNIDAIKFGVVQEIINYDGNKENEILRTYGTEPQVLFKDNIPAHWFALKKSLILNTIWNGLYNKQFLDKNKIVFNEKIYLGCDDQIFNIECFKNLKSVIINPQIYYIWIQRKSHSLSLKYEINRLEEHYILLETEEALVRQFKINNKKEWALKLYDYFYDSLIKICSIYSSTTNKEKRILLGEVCDYNIYKKNFTVKYILSLLFMNQKAAVCILLTKMGIAGKKLLIIITKNYCKERKI